MEEKFFLEECPICRGPGMLMHEGGWNVQVECADTVTAEQLAAAVEGAGEKFHALSVTAA